MSKVGGNLKEKRTFGILRAIILESLEHSKKTINQISNDTDINWKTVENHLTYLLGKSLVNEVFSSEYVRIFEATSLGKECLGVLKQDIQDDGTLNLDNVKTNSNGVIKI